MEADPSRKKGDSEMKKMIVIAIKPLPGQETAKDTLLQDSTDQTTLESVSVLYHPVIFATEMIFNQYQLALLVLYEEQSVQVRREACAETI